MGRGAVAENEFTRPVLPTRRPEARQPLHSQGPPRSGTPPCPPAVGPGTGSENQATPLRDSVTVEIVSLPFEFIVDGSPVSQQAKKASRRRAWQSDVAAAAARPWQARPAVVEDCAVTINYFCFDTTEDRRHSLDVDNVPKPILDALKGLVYVDDKQVIDVVCRRRNLFEDLRTDNLAPFLTAYVLGPDPFVYVAIATADSRELSL